MSWAEPPRQGQRKDLNVVALLSLKLLLLAFFILLNTLSKFEDEKTRRVLESVNDAFNGQVQSVRNADSRSGAVGALNDSRSLIAELQRLFKTQLPAVKVKKSDQAGQFRLELPAQRLFRDGNAQLRRGRMVLLKRVSEALRRRQAAGLDFRLRLFYGVETTRERRFGAPVPTLLEIRRISRLLEEFEAREVARDRLSMGIEPRQEGRVILEFTLPGPAEAEPEPEPEPEPGADAG